MTQHTCAMYLPTAKISCHRFSIMVTLSLCLSAQPRSATQEVRISVRECERSFPRFQASLPLPHTCMQDMLTAIMGCGNTEHLPTLSSLTVKKSTFKGDFVCS